MTGKKLAMAARIEISPTMTIDDAGALSQREHGRQFPTPAP